MSAPACRVTLCDESMQVYRMETLIVMGVFQATKNYFLVKSAFHNKTIQRFMLVYDLFDYKKKLPFEVLQTAVREKPAKLKEFTLLIVRLWLVLEYFRNGNFREF